ncbi:MAG: hypothetical protein D6820_08455 [Lentisphaerae bacterium]|nr:MAG: hypothetical protein D6820_08455 [Lentisphaerota bacterium]
MEQVLNSWIVVSRQYRRLWIRPSLKHQSSLLECAAQTWTPRKTTPEEKNWRKKTPCLKNQSIFPFGKGNRTIFGV